MLASTSDSHTRMRNLRARGSVCTDSLRLDNNAFIAEVLAANTGRKSVVAMTTPGATLTDWRASASAIVNMFLGGQESGNAWADVLFGDVAPGGKLPLTFPKTETDTIEPCNYDNMPCTYSEGLMMGYRAGLDGAAFAFGHGLSYGHFQYDWPSTTDSGACDDGSGEGGDVVACLSFTVTLAHSTVGAALSEVAQLYLSFPASANEPELVLRNFKRVVLQGEGDAATVTFGVTSRDVSTCQCGRSISIS